MCERAACVCTPRYGCVCVCVCHVIAISHRPGKLVLCRNRAGQRWSVDNASGEYRMYKMYIPRRPTSVCSVPTSSHKPRFAMAAFVHRIFRVSFAVVFAWLQNSRPRNAVPTIYNGIPFIAGWFSSVCRARAPISPVSLPGAVCPLVPRYRRRFDIRRFAGEGADYGNNVPRRTCDAHARSIVVYGLTDLGPILAIKNRISCARRRFARRLLLATGLRRTIGLHHASHRWRCFADGVPLPRPSGCFVRCVSDGRRPVHMPVEKSPTAIRAGRRHGPLFVARGHPRRQVGLQTVGGRSRRFGRVVHD